MIFIYQGQRTVIRNTVLDIETILMTLGNGVLEQGTVVVQERDSDVVDLHFVKGDEGVHVAVDDDAGGLVDHEYVVEDYWV